MVKPKIIENKRVNKGYFRVVLEFEDDLVGAYCNDDGIDKIVKLNENGEDVDFDNLDDGATIRIANVLIGFDESSDTVLISAE